VRWNELPLPRAAGRVWKKFKYAEGWRRHLHYGFSTAELDPLRAALGKNYLMNKSYARAVTGMV